MRSRVAAWVLGISTTIAVVAACVPLPPQNLPRRGGTTAPDPPQEAAVPAAPDAGALQ